MRPSEYRVEPVFHMVELALDLITVGEEDARNLSMGMEGSCRFWRIRLELANARLFHRSLDLYASGYEPDGQGGL